MTAARITAGIASLAAAATFGKLAHTDLRDRTDKWSLALDTLSAVVGVQWAVLLLRRRA